MPGEPWIHRQFLVNREDTRSHAKAVDLGSIEHRKSNTNPVEKDRIKDRLKDRIKDRLNDRIKDEKPVYPEKSISKPEDKEKILMQKIIENPLVTAEELAVTLNMNVRNTRKYLAKLKEEGKIKRVGSRKNGNWEVI